MDCAPDSDGRGPGRVGRTGRPDGRVRAAGAGGNGWSVEGDGDGGNEMNVGGNWGNGDATIGSRN
ncbi:hypothetical protein EJB05_28684 [Eragrostis curvula]|uniref:Uncharacterized protein n=1 Tax=Eragrostis curvula TaxID=38414 RepID=A0A5J9US51_9POAL|nr:hypothetical protein EJB05_28684 [Eragrostis curvula]